MVIIIFTLIMEYLVFYHPNDLSYIL